MIKTLSLNCRGVGSIPVRELRSYMLHGVAKKKKKKGRSYTKSHLSHEKMCNITSRQKCKSVPHRDSTHMPE